MQVTILEEAGFKWAMRGLARSYNQNIESMPTVALKLGPKDKGHNKFLESIQVWLDIEAPRFWWSEMDTYRAGISKQSDSTIHTLSRQELTQDNFEKPIDQEYLNYLNILIRQKASIEELKNALPDGFIQGRTVNLNYKVIRHIMIQRYNHKLSQWHVLCDAMRDLEHYELLGIDILKPSVG